MIKKIFAIYLLISFYFGGLLLAQDHFLVGLKQSNTALQLLLPNQYSSEEIELIKEAFWLGTKSQADFVNLQAFSPIENCLSPNLKGTKTGTYLIEEDLTLKRLFRKRFAFHLTSSPEGPASLRLWIRPTRLQISKAGDGIAITRIRLALLLEKDLPPGPISQALESARRDLEMRINSAPEFRGLRTILASYYLGKVFSASSPNQTTKQTTALGGIVKAYLWDYDRSGLVGGILLPNDVEIKTLRVDDLPQAYEISLNPSFPNGGSLPDSNLLLKALAGDYHLLHELLSPRLYPPTPPKPELVDEALGELLEQYGDRLGPSHRLSLEHRSPYETYISFLSSLIKNNHPISERHLHLAGWIWATASPSSKGRLLSLLCEDRIVMTPKNLSRRRFLFWMGLSLSLPLVPRISFSGEAVSSEANFLHLPVEKQRRLLQAYLTNRLDITQRNRIRKEVKGFARRYIRPFASEDPLIASRLLESGAISILEETLQKAFILKYASSRRTQKRSLYRFASRCLVKEPSHSTISVKALLRAIASAPQLFPESVRKEAWRRLARLMRYRSNYPFLSRLATDVVRRLNRIHDDFERLGWRNKASRYLRGLPDQLLYISLALGEYGLYTATYLLLREEWSRRLARYDHSILSALKRLDPKGMLVYELTITFAKRERYPVSLLKGQEKLHPKRWLSVVSKRALNYLRWRLTPKNYSYRAVNQAYLIRMLKEIADRSPTHRTPILTGLRSILQNQKVHPAVKHMIAIAFQKELTDNWDPDRLDLRLVNRIRQFLSKPPYPKVPKIRSAILFFRDATAYSPELERLLTRAGYKRIQHHSWRKDINGVSLEIETIFLPKGLRPAKRRFEEILHSGRYHLIFTRHHSFSGRHFGGAGSTSILPQFVGVAQTGYGQQNNLLALVLSEEVARGWKHKDPWDLVWKRMKSRMDLENFIPPNDLLFLEAYLCALFNPARSRPLPNKLTPIVIVDGGCGGINRIPEYIANHYVTPIKWYSRLLQLSLMKHPLERIDKLVIRIKGLPLKLITKMQALAKAISAPRQDSSQPHGPARVKSGGIEF